MLNEYISGRENTDSTDKCLDKTGQYGSHPSVHIYPIYLSKYINDTKKQTRQYNKDCKETVKRGVKRIRI